MKTPFNTTVNMTQGSVVPNGGKVVRVLKHNIFAGPVSKAWEQAAWQAGTNSRAGWCCRKGQILPICVARKAARFVCVGLDS